MQSSIISAIPGIEWPALPGNQGVGRLATLFQLEQSQWWPEEKLKTFQFKQLTTLLRHAIENVPYYQQTLDSKLLSEPLDEHRWQSIPLLTREQLQNASQNMNATKMPNHGGVAKARTSGSTGKPVEILQSQICEHFWNTFTLRDHIWHKRELDKKLAVIRYSQSQKASSPGGEYSDNWGKATFELCKTGPCVSKNIHAPVNELADWIKRQQPDLLLTHPSVLQELAMYCETNGYSFDFLSEVRTISEALPDDLRNLCQRVWQVPLTDVYSTIELGYLALQCPDNDHYHVQSEGVYLEVLDDNNQPCKLGEVGRVVATNLHNFVSPLIRYEVGDYAEVGEACSCGRGLPVLKRILGRTRNFVTLPDGTRHWPKFGIAKILEIAPVKQYQAIQHTTHEIEYRLVVERSLSESETSQLKKLFVKMLHPEITVTINEVDSIPRSPGGKYEEFLSLIS